LKRILAILLCLLLFCTVPFVAIADDTGGNGNIDGGDGGMGSGTDENKWHSGDDGVRITVVDANSGAPVTTPIDWTNINPTVDYYFGKVSKVQYRSGKQLSVTTSKYTYVNPQETMPQIISSDGNTNIDAIKKFFCSQFAVQLISNETGIPYNKLISGAYKLFLEPIAYITFQGQRVAMSATEAALYDSMLGSGLRSKMASLTSKNLPFSMFLQTPDLGFTAYAGATTQNQPDDTIISSLGLGIVKFTPTPVNPPTTNNSYEYRVNTDVITPVELYSSDAIGPDNPAQVTFRIKDSSYTVTNIVIPQDESQIVWFKWHTPSTPQDITITSSNSQGVLSQKTISVKVVSIAASDPPNPTATDTNNGFTAVGVPQKSEVTGATWGVWSSYWHENWVWVSAWEWVGGSDGHWVDNGQWNDYGWWDYTRATYTVSFSGSMNASPDDKVPTADGDTMKSGYGVKATVAANLSTNAPDSAFTGAQTAITYFPEFHYQTYWRILDLTTGGLVAQFQFKPNPYSTYDRRVHFTPLWYPSGLYTLYTYVQDVWTPAGMLSENLTGYVNISGSLYDDWHIGPLLP